METVCGTVTMQSLLLAMQQRNLVYNYDFRYYSNKVITGNDISYNSPDGWIYLDPGRNGKIGFDPANNTCIITKSEDNSPMRFAQALHEFPRWQSILAGRKVTAKAILNIPSGAEVTLSLTDGVDACTIARKGSGLTEMVVHLIIHPKSAAVLLTVGCATPFARIAVYSMCANVGEVALDNLPCTVQGIIGERRQYIATDNPPAEELSLCNPPVELGIDFSRLNSVINGRFGTGPNKRSLLPDMRGYFSRAWDHGAATDPDAGQRKPLGGTIKGDNVGTLEEDEFLKHDHQLSFSTDKPILTGKEGSATIINTGNTSNTKPAGGKETRPKNLAELFTIKWA